MEARALSADYVPPQRYVTLLRRLELRRSGQQGGSTPADGAPADAAQQPPTADAYEEYRVAIRTAPSRRPEYRSPSPGLRRRSPSPTPAGDGTSPSAEGEDVDNQPGSVAGPLDTLRKSSAEDDRHASDVTATAFDDHDRAIVQHNARSEVVSTVLSRERPMDFYVTTAEVTAKEQKGQRKPTYESNLEDIAALTATRRRAPSPDEDLAAQPVEAKDAASKTAPAASQKPAVATLKKATSKITAARSLAGNRGQGGGSAYEPSEFVAMRNRVAEAQKKMDEMKADFERQLREAALRADLENQALRVEAERSLEDLREQLESTTKDFREARDELAAAQKQVHRLTGFEQDVSRLTRLLDEERVKRRQLEVHNDELQAEVAAIPAKIREYTAEVAAERDETLAAKAALADELQGEKDRSAQLEADIETLRGRLTSEQGRSAGLAEELAVGSQRLEDNKQELERTVAERDGLLAKQADFETEAAAKVQRDIDAAYEEARIKSRAYESLMNDKNVLEAEAVKLRETAEAFEVQQKTLKRTMRELTTAREEVSELHAYRQKLTERRMHHIFTNICLKLHLARVLRPNGMADRLKAAEAQNAWLFERLQETSSLAHKRLHPAGHRTRRLLARPDDEERALRERDEDEERTRQEQEAADDAAAAGVGGIYVVDSYSQTNPDDLRGGAPPPMNPAALLASASGAVPSASGTTFQSPIAPPAIAQRSPQAQRDALAAASESAEVRLRASISGSHVATSPGAGRLTERGLAEAARNASREGSLAAAMANEASDATGGESTGDVNSPPVQGTRDLHRRSRASSAASHRREGDSVRVHQQTASRTGQIPRRAGSAAAGTGHRNHTNRPSSASPAPASSSSAAQHTSQSNLKPSVSSAALSIDSRYSPSVDVGRDVSPPQGLVGAGIPASLLVVGTTGPADAVLATNPYNYFGRNVDGPSSTRPASQQQQQPAGVDGWMPTAYAVGSFPTVAHPAEAHHDHPGGPTTARPLSAMSHSSASSRRLLRRDRHPQPVPSPDAMMTTMDVVATSLPPDVVRSDAPQSAANMQVLPSMQPVMPRPNLPAGAWARGDFEREPSSLC